MTSSEGVVLKVMSQNGVWEVEIIIGAMEYDAGGWYSGTVPTDRLPGIQKSPTKTRSMTIPNAGDCHQPHHL